MRQTIEEEFRSRQPAASDYGLTRNVVDGALEILVMPFLELLLRPPQ